MRTPMTDDGFAFDSEAFQRYGGSSGERQPALSLLPLLSHTSRLCLSPYTAWLSNLLTTGQSRILARISEHLTATIGVASVIAVAFGAANAGVLPPDAANIVEACALPQLPHEAVGSFIGLLLAFRTSQAYDRFWEARTLWDGVYSSTRSIVRLTSAVGSAEGKAAAKPSSKAAAATWDDATVSAAGLIVGLTGAFPYALKQHLRGVRNLRELVDAASAASACPRRCVTSRRLVACSKQPNVPLAILESISRALLHLRAEHGDLVWWQLDSKVEELINILSKAERIKGTPVPISYSRHTSRFFSVYAFTLPLSLASHINLFLLPPTVGIISWVIFATEEIGHIIEEPFGRGLSDDPDQPDRVYAAGDDVDAKGGPIQLEVLPLGRYCADIASDAATIFLASPATMGEMPGGDDELTLFDELD